MPSVTFDDEGVRAAMRTYLAAVDAVTLAADDATVLSLGDAKTVAGLNLRKALTDAGWTAPAGQRSTT